MSAEAAFALLAASHALLGLARVVRDIVVMQHLRALMTGCDAEQRSRVCGQLTTALHNGSSCASPPDTGTARRR
ncbi:hypothetical protein [Streptomyces abikoensis]|uniref:hypothetical protein n=1 Tax=Streptomyces abikoensis TaxID=97398 RepID=UPI0033C8716E